jgi:hypothetical protein
MTSYIIYVRKNCVCRKNAALAHPPHPPPLKHGTHDAPVHKICIANYHKKLPPLEIMYEGNLCILSKQFRRLISEYFR